MRLLYSVRDPSAVLYAAELARLVDGAGDAAGPEVTFAWTRSSPRDSDRPPGRVDAALLASSAWPADVQPTCYVCGPTGFVERVADLLVAAGHDASRIRTERFGPTGGGRR
jgi:ferredoxin-NADP reductase